jgi:hypothetical protein
MTFLIPATLEEAGRWQRTGTVAYGNNPGYSGGREASPGKTPTSTEKKQAQWYKPVIPAMWET